MTVDLPVPVGFPCIYLSLGVELPPPPPAEGDEKPAEGEASVPIADKQVPTIPLNTEFHSVL